MKKTGFSPAKLVQEYANKMKNTKEPLVRSPVKVPFKDK